MKNYIDDNNHLSIINKKSIIRTKVMHLLPN